MIGPNDPANTGNPADPLDKPLKDLEKLIVTMTKNRASEFRLKSGKRPVFHIAAGPREVGNRPLTHEEVMRIVRELLDERQVERHELEQDLNFACSIPGCGRFLVKTFHDPAEPGTIEVSVGPA